MRDMGNVRFVLIWKFLILFVGNAESILLKLAVIIALVKPESAGQFIIA